MLIVGELCGAIAALLSATLLLAAGHTAGQPSASYVGDVEVIAVDFQGRLPDHAVYLRTHHNGQHTAFKLEGPRVEALRTGQRVRISAAGLGSVGTAIGSTASGYVQRLLVSSVETLQEPARPQPHPAVVVKLGGSAAVPAGRRLAQQLQQQQLPTVQLQSSNAASIDTLVMPISFEGCPAPTGGMYQRPWWTKQDIEPVFFEDGRPNGAWATVGGRFRACSYGQSSLSRNNSRVTGMVRLPCKGKSSWGTLFSSRACTGDYIGWYEAAMDRMAAWKINHTRYRYKLLILPPGTACDFIGAAHLGCGLSCASWVQGATLMGSTREAQRATHPVHHEMGHNLYMHHGTAPSWEGTVAEYGDLSDAVGQCCTTRCYNAPHAFQLGWLAPQLLDGSSLGAGETRSVTFLAQPRSKFSGLLVNATTWAPAAAPIYISYRLAERGDVKMPRAYVNRVSIHSWRGRDNYSAGDKTLLLGVLAKGGSLTYGNAAISIRVTNTNPAAGTATVAVTRAGSKRTRGLLGGGAV